MVDSVVDEYEQVAAELEIDVQEVEASVFSAERTSDSSRIYRLKRETLEFRRAVIPLREPVQRFALGAMPEDAQPYFRDIADHLSRVAESIDNTDKLLDNALSAHLAQLSIQQNDDMRKLTAGAALFAIPTAIAGIYGMNFEHMPELTWTFGYPLVARSDRAAVCLRLRAVQEVRLAVIQLTVVAAPITPAPSEHEHQAAEADPVHDERHVRLRADVPEQPVDDRQPDGERHQRCRRPWASSRTRSRRRGCP